MDPDVPQALRLQGILIGGVRICALHTSAGCADRDVAGGIVIIYDLQQGFLLDDCNDAMVRSVCLCCQCAEAPSTAKACVQRKTVKPDFGNRKKLAAR